ncbi:MAG: hypothetical protein L6R00_02660 [Phycisphaerae bacterium]|nr:hypothetical protein [Phycisphaerae bacterium]
MKRVLVLPGASSRTGSSEYLQVYATIEREAVRRRLFVEIPVYPGQRGEESGRVSYASALEHAERVVADFKPDWIIARSFGCHIALGLYEGLEPLPGLVLWGPSLSSAIERLYGTTESRQNVYEGSRKHDVWLAEDFFETLPAMEEQIREVPCPIRIARGSRDDENSRADIAKLAQIHRERHPSSSREAVEIVGLAHSVVAGSVRETTLEKYFWCLFEPIVDRQDVLVL